MNGQVALTCSVKASVLGIVGKKKFKLDKEIKLLLIFRKNFVVVCTLALNVQGFRHKSIVIGE